MAKVGEELEVWPCFALLLLDSCRGPFLHAVYMSDWFSGSPWSVGDQGLVAGANLVVSTVSIRQKRVRSASCVIPTQFMGSATLNDCIADYDPSVEVKSSDEIERSVNFLDLLLSRVTGYIHIRSILHRAGVGHRLHIQPLLACFRWRNVLLQVQGRLRCLCEAAMREHRSLRSRSGQLRRLCGGAARDGVHPRQGQAALHLQGRQVRGPGPAVPSGLLVRQAAEHPCARVGAARRGREIQVSISDGWINRSGRS